MVHGFSSICFMSRHGAFDADLKLLCALKALSQHYLRNLNLTLTYHSFLIVCEFASFPADDTPSSNKQCTATNDPSKCMYHSLLQMGCPSVVLNTKTSLATQGLLCMG